MADLLHLLLVGAGEFVHVAVDLLHMHLRTSLLLQVPHGLELAAGVHDAREDQVTEHLIGNGPEADLLEEPPQYEFGTQQDHITDTLEGGIEPVLFVLEVQVQTLLARALRYETRCPLLQIMDVGLFLGRTDRTHQYVLPATLFQHLNTHASRSIALLTVKHTQRTARVTQTRPTHPRLSRDTGRWAGQNVKSVQNRKRAS